MADQELSDAVNQEAADMEKKKPGLFSYLFQGSLAAATTWVGYAAVGFGGPLTGLGFAAGSAILNLFNKAENEKSEGLLGILRSYNVGSLLGFIGVPMYNLAGQYIADPLVRGVLGATAGNAVWSSAYIGTNHVLKNGFEGLGEAYKKDWAKLTAHSMLWLGLPVAMTINGYWGGYPGIIGIDTGFRVLAGLVQGQKTAHDQSAQQSYTPPPPQAPQPSPAT